MEDSHRDAAAYMESILFISKLHRRLGRGFSMMDFDAFMALEYAARHEPAAIVEYKDGRWVDSDRSVEGMAAMVNLAKGYRSSVHRRGIPFLRVQYFPDDHDRFLVMGKSEMTREMYVPREISMTFEEFKQLLTRIRAVLSRT